MFGLFKSTDKGPKVIDKVWMSNVAKLKACRQMLQVDPTCVFITWFEDTRTELIIALQLPPDNTTVLMAENAGIHQVQNGIVAFAEHHPLRAKEEQVFKRLMLTEVNVLSSLDEPFFAQFGGGRIVEVIRKLGMNEDEIIEHSFVNRAIKNAQEKIGKKVVVEKAANSQEKWYQLNVG